MAITVLALIGIVGWQLWSGSRLSIRTFGFHFLVSSDWDPVNDHYGALPFIFGTLVSSCIALVIAVPLSVATAIYLTELAPRWLRQPVISLIEMLAAIPSVILGLWGIFVIGPMAARICPALPAPSPRLVPSFPRHDLRPLHARRRHDHRHHDHPHHHLGFPRDPHLRPRPPTRSRIRARRDSLGGYSHRRPQLRQARHLRRHHPRPWPRLGRDDGRHHGHRQ